MKLCELTDGVLLDSLGQLDSCLSRWKELLDPITLAVVVSVLRTRLHTEPAGAATGQVHELVCVRIPCRHLGTALLGELSARNRVVLLLAASSLTLPPALPTAVCACVLLSQRDESCLDAVASASSTLADEGQVLTQARQLSRCLAFRQLLSEALAQALASTFPAAGATVDAVASNMQLYAAEGSGRAAEAAAGDWGGLVAGRHVCDLFDLPRPGLQGVGAPAVADPVVVNTLVGE